MEEEKREEQEKDISIKSPKENVAEKQMIAIEDANIRIKKLIVKSLRVGVDLKELNKQILEIQKRMESFKNILNCTSYNTNNESINAKVV